MNSTIDARRAELAPRTAVPLAQHHTRLRSALDVLRLVEQLVPVDQLAAIVIEFLSTAELSETVQWRDLIRHDGQAHRAVS